MQCHPSIWAWIGDGDLRLNLTLFVISGSLDLEWPEGKHNYTMVLWEITVEQRTSWFSNGVNPLCSSFRLNLCIRSINCRQRRILSIIMQIVLILRQNSKTSWVWYMNIKIHMKHWRTWKRTYALCLDWKYEERGTATQIERLAHCKTLQWWDAC